MVHLLPHIRAWHFSAPKNPSPAAQYSHFPERSRAPPISAKMLSDPPDTSKMLIRPYGHIPNLSDQATASKNPHGQDLPSKITLNSPTSKSRSASQPARRTAASAPE